MTRDKFLHELEKELKVLSKDERLDMIHDYEEHFDLGLEAGKTEEEVAESLGAPIQIAKELLATYQVNQDDVDQKNVKSKSESVLRSTMVMFMLGFFNLVFVIWIPFAVAALIFAFWCMAVALLTAPLLVIVNAILFSGVFAWFDLFFSLAMCGAGYFLGLGLWYATKLAIKMSIWYVKFNVKLVKEA